MKKAVGTQRVDWQRSLHNIEAQPKCIAVNIIYNHIIFDQKKTQKYGDGKTPIAHIYNIRK